MTYTVHDYISFISIYIWPIFRLSGLFFSLPVISSAMVPSRVRIAMVVTFTLVIAPTISQAPSLELLSPAALMLVAQELLIGVLMGFVFQLVFQAFIIGGQVIAMQGGLGFATMVDPSSNANVPLVSQYYLMFVTLLFLVLDGHLHLFKILAQSYDVFPLAQITFDRAIFWHILLFSSWMFKGAVLLALPAIGSLLVVNMSFGIMTKAAPQINIFSIGFPITLIFSISIIYITLYSVLPIAILLVNEGLTLLEGLFN